MLVAFAYAGTSIMYKCSKFGISARNAQNVKSQQDPGIPVGGDANPRGGCQHMILPNFPKNFMELRTV